MAEVMVSSSSPVAYRQLASVILKQYVECHWSRDSDKFCEPVPTDVTKAAIRRMLPAGLGDSHSKIRATVAYAVSAIAHWDWPESWPELFDQLVLALSSGDANLVHGAMRVLTEFCHDVSDLQMPHVAPVIFPQLLRILLQPTVYSVRTRSRAVHIFNTCATLIYAISAAYPEAPSTLLLPTLPNYVAAFVYLLSSREEGSTDPGLRKEVVMALCSLLRSFPSAMAAHTMEIVTPVWNILQGTTPVYVQSVVNCREPENSVCDSDGEVLGHESTTFAIFEFISALSESRRLQRLLPPILPDLCYHLIAHMQITEDQVHSWLEDVNQFVEEDENEFSYSIRLSAHDLIQMLAEESALKVSCYQAVMSAIERHIQGTPSHPAEHRWKVHEACLLAVSCVLEPLKAGEVHFDCQPFAERLLLPSLASTAFPLLTGRCLWLAGKMAAILSPELVSQLLEVVARALEPAQHNTLRVLAAKATYYFCSELQGRERGVLLGPCLPRLLDSLITMATEASEETLPLVLEALQLLAQVDKKVTAESSGRLVPVAMALFLKYSHDPGASSCLEELFEALAATPGCQESLLTRLLPTAVDILQSSDSQLPLGLVAAMLDVLVLVVRGCGSAGLPQELVTQVFPRVVQRILASDDSSVLQNGGECVRAFLSTGVEQLAARKDAAGYSGLHYVVQVIVHLLDPGRPEFSAAFVGKLIVVFVNKASIVLSQHLQLLLRSVLSKMQVVQTSSVMQSLLLVFAHLIQTELEAVVAFLSQVPDPQGRPALHFVMTEWAAKHPFFFGVFEMRVSTLALCKLLSHCITSGDERLSKIMVQGEEVPSTGEGIQTRSSRQAAPQQWTEVPLPVKLVKLLIGDLQNLLEVQGAGREGESSSEAGGPA